MLVSLRYFDVRCLVVVCSAFSIALSSGCGADNAGGYAEPSAQGANAGQAPGVGGAGTGGGAGGNTSATGGYANGGAGASTVGAGGKSTNTVAAAGGVDAFWTEGYNVTQLPTPADGRHHPGVSCIESGCHDGSDNKAPAYLFAGTVFGEAGFSGAVNVEVGISDGSHAYFVYTGTNGNFWLPSGAGPLDLTQASIRLINTRGQRIKLSSSHRGASCNFCHAGTATSEAKLLIAP